MRRAAQHTPDWEYAATIDGDILIVEPDWPINTLRALQLYKSVQISSELVFLDPAGRDIGKISSIIRALPCSIGERLPDAAA